MVRITIRTGEFMYTQLECEPLNQSFVVGSGSVLSRALQSVGYRHNSSDLASRLRRQADFPCYAARFPTYLLSQST